MAVQLMGIINLTDNSFLGESRLDPSDSGAVVRRAGQLFQAGASIVDIGACSTAPGNSPVDEQVEWSRLEEPLGALFEAFPDKVFSIDTFRCNIVRKALKLRSEVPMNTHLQAGGLIINDVRASQMDSSMLSTVAEAGLVYVAMDSSEDPGKFFHSFDAVAQDYGIREWIADPGFGFGKSLARNWELLHELHKLRCPGRRLLVALSRKRMIYQPDGLTPENCAQKSVRAELLAAELGADIIRTHDVAALKALI